MKNIKVIKSANIKNNSIELLKVEENNPTLSILYGVRVNAQSPYLYMSESEAYDAFERYSWMLVTRED